MEAPGKEWAESLKEEVASLERENARLEAEVARLRALLIQSGCEEPSVAKAPVLKGPVPKDRDNGYRFDGAWS